jgi:lysozyme family protein
MADFQQFYPRLLTAEGGYCHTLGDAGGETWCGVARAYHPNWTGWRLVDATKLRLGLAGRVPPAHYAALTKALAADAALAAQVRAFYKASYWDVLRLDELRSQAVAEQLADHGVNAGTARPARMLQYALRQLGYTRLTEDGCLGPRTLAAANDCPAPALFREVKALREAFYCYRAGAMAPAPGAPLHGLFQRLLLRPDVQQARFLKSWLARVAAIPGPAA